MPSLKIKRGTRTQINSAASAGTLSAGEPYLITDENRIAIGISGTSYQDFAKLSEAGGGGETTVVLASDVATSSTTYSNVTNMSFEVLANRTYHFYAVIFYTSNATNNGSRWSITGPDSPTLLAFQTTCSASGTSSKVDYNSAYDTPAAASAGSVVAGNIAVIEGFIRPSAAGTVQVRFASELSSGGATITAKAGSYIKYEEVLA